MKKIVYALTTSLLLLLLAACNMPRSTSSSVDQTAIINTSVAKTVAAGLVASVQPTDQLPSTNTQTPDSGIEDTPQPSGTPIPNTATPSVTPIPCNLAKFIDDVTIPDGTVFEPGETLTKTWSLKNVGSCTWTSGYDIVFSSGDALGAPSAVQTTTGTVAPGQIVEVSVDLISPDSAGTYRGNWQVRDSSDEIFGIENSDSGYFWVEIKVVVPTNTPEPQSSILHRSGYSKTLSQGGRSSDTRLGIAPNGDALRAFLDYDLSILAGLSSSSTIQSATLDVSNFSGNSCFEFLHPLKAGRIDYGTTADYPSDFNQVPSVSIFSVPSGAEIASPIDITSILQDFIGDEGAGHFQFRMELEHDDAGAAFKCVMEWPDPLIHITYLP